MKLLGDQETVTLRSSNAMSKKVTAGRVVVGETPDKDWIFRVGDAKADGAQWAKPVVVYQRRRKRTEMEGMVEPGIGKVESGGGYENHETGSKMRKVVVKEMESSDLGIGTRSSERATKFRVCYSETRRRNGKVCGDGNKKRWLELSFEGVDPLAFVGLLCKVFWPMDDDWYAGSVSKYVQESERHEVTYKDGDVENLVLSREKIKFYVSFDEMQQLNLKCSFPVITTSDASWHHEMLGLAMIYGEAENFEQGDVVWAKLAGYPMWPAVIIDVFGEVGPASVQKQTSGDKVISVSVQFFGTHDFARVNTKMVRTFLSGLVSSFHQKCKQKQFERSLQEVQMYICNQRLPNEMIQRQTEIAAKHGRNTGSEDGGSTDSPDEYDHKEVAMIVETMRACPLEIGSLCVTSLGKIVYDSEYFHNRKYIWPVGYTASRKFISVSNPDVTVVYKMEVLRNPRSKDRPLFRVTLEDGDQIEGTTPHICWKTIYNRIRKACDSHSATTEESSLQKSGSYMFGFSNPKISQLIQGLPNSKFCLKYFAKVSDMPPGFKPIFHNRKDIDRCDVCHMDEEYEDNLFLQCDKCCMTVHARCYGEIEPLDGVLWLCNLCRPGAPLSQPVCCLCPVTGGAIKPTTDGRWAHLTCAIWIPETCFLDVRKMEPIDGICRISKDRWKLLCSICGVPYGACIQCSNSNCYASYHPLCARAAGFCIEPEDEDQAHLLSDDEENAQCIRLLSFCKKHMPLRKECSPVEDEPVVPKMTVSTYIPPSNPSGCSRTEPYNFFERRGQKEPRAITAASKKWLFLDNTPYLISGCRQSGGGFCGHAIADGVEKCGMPLRPPLSISSIYDKYLHMKATYRKRLAFGKSKVHGFGVFAKVFHKTGDMIVEYTGEVVRPRIADIRERRIYNSLVGAGTYMFHIDNERVVDATRAGSIAHLINHSCEPNCYSRMFTVQGQEHIIICAKRDIDRWEELTYDYRFLSKDEQLACFCGSPKCRGVVNDVEALEQSGQLWVAKKELTPYTGN